MSEDLCERYLSVDKTALLKLENDSRVRKKRRINIGFLLIWAVTYCAVSSKNLRIFYNHVRI